MLSVIRLAREFWSEKYAVWHLFLHDAITETRGSRSSVAWNIILPLVPLGFYIALSVINVFPDADGMNRLTFVSIGVTLWVLFVGFITTPMNGLEAALKSAETSRLSIISQLFIKLGRVIADTVVRVIAVCVILWAFSPDVVALNWVFVLNILMAVICCFAVGVFLGVLNLLSGDISRFIVVSLQYGIFVSGVIFPITHLGSLATFFQYNPLFIAVDSTRQMIVLGTYTPSPAYWGLIALGLVVLLWTASILCILRDELRGRV